MIDHPLGELADYIEGRLEPPRMKEIDEHLAGCRECADDFAWAQNLRAAVLGEGLRHLEPSRIVDLSDGLGDPLSEPERRHIEMCEDCRRELDWSKSLPPVGDISGRDAVLLSGQAGTRVPRTVQRIGWVAAIAAAAVVAIIVLRRPPSGYDATQLARIEPLPVRIVRGPVEEGSFEEQRIRALEFYADGNYEGARDAFTRADRLRPDDAVVLLYLGSTEMLLGHPDAALGFLRRATALPAEPAVHDEALWQLANELLRDRRLDEARSLFETIAGSGSRYGVDARAILDRLGR